MDDILALVNSKAASPAGLMSHELQEAYTDQVVEGHPVANSIVEFSHVVFKRPH